MNIYAKVGDKVRFTNTSGHGIEREKAAAILSTEESYTVDYVNVGGWVSYVSLAEYPNRTFNTVMFEDVGAK